MNGHWRNGSIRIVAAAIVTALLFSFCGVADAAYVNERRVVISSPEETFTDGAGVRGTYALDTQVAVDKGGNIWVWGYYNVCTIGNAGQSGSSSSNPVNGASYTLDQPGGSITRDCGNHTLNNRPAVIKGVNGFTSVAGSAYALMAVDKQGNLYGWGDNTQGARFAVPSSASLKASGGGATLVSGGVFGLYKDGTALPEALPDKVNQMNPNESDDTWKPIDGPDAPLPTGNDRVPYAQGLNKSKVVSVASNEYAFAYLKEDGTVWTVGQNGFGQRGVGKQGNGFGSWGLLNGRSTGYPFDASGGVSTRPTQVRFPDGVKIKYISNSYEGYHAVDTDNNVWYWGRNYDGNSGLTDDELKAVSGRDSGSSCYLLSASTMDAYCYSPVKVPSLTNVVRTNGLRKFAEGYQFGCLLDDHGKLWVWGASINKVGMPDSDANSNAVWSATPSVFSATTNTGRRFTADHIVDINAGFHAGQMVTDDGYVYGWGEAYLGGAQFADLSPDASNSPWNSSHRVGVVWDPTRDPLHRKATKVGGNKDAANLNLEDGSIYSWGENGGGAALGGRGYGQTVCAEGLPVCVSPKIGMTGGRVQGGLYVWPATFVPDIQNVGRYETLVKNSYPFQDTGVHKGQIVEYTLKLANDRTGYQNPAVRVEDTWGSGASLVPDSFRAKYTISNGHVIDADTDPRWDVTSKFTLTDTGFNSNDPSMVLSPQSTLIITYKVKVTGDSGTVGGKALLTRVSNGAEIDSDQTYNPVVK